MYTMVLKLVLGGIFAAIVLLQCASYITAIPLEDFYDYGPCVDRFLPQRDEIFRKLELSVPINFYGSYTCRLFVSDNGHVSLIPRKPYIPLRLPSEIPFPFIAPFQSDVDIRRRKKDGGDGDGDGDGDGGPVGPGMSATSESDSDRGTLDTTNDDDEFMDLDLFDVTESFEDAMERLTTAEGLGGGGKGKPEQCNCSLPEPPPLDYCIDDIIIVRQRELPPDFPPDCPCPDIPIVSSTQTNEVLVCEDPQVSNSKQKSASKMKRKGSSRICPPPGRVWFRESTDPAELCRAQREVMFGFEVDDFTPSALAIVTWDHVGSFRRMNRRTNTFQLIIASDGQVSFVIFLYADDEMQWSIPFDNGVAGVLLPGGGGPPIGPPPPFPFDGPPPPPPPTGDGRDPAMESSPQLPAGGPPQDGPPQDGPPRGGPPPGFLEFIQRFLRGPRATVGINAGDLHRYQRTDYHESAQTVNIDQTSNVDFPGVYMFKLDGAVEVGLTQTQLSVIEDMNGNRHGGRGKGEGKGKGKGKGKRRPSVVEVCLSVSGPGTIGLRPLEFELTAIGGSAIESSKDVDGDFRITRMPIIMFGESVIECTKILIVPDDVHEGIEEFTISVSQICPCGKDGDKLPPFLQPTPVTISPSIADIRIIDNDEIIIGVLETVIDVFEDDESGNPMVFEVCVTMFNGTLEGSLDIVLTTYPGSAIADEDYCSQNVTLTIDDRDNDIVCVEFSTKHDTDVEGEEEFFVKLTLLGPELGVIIDPDLEEATITILDNEYIIALEQDTTEVVEGSTVEVCANLTSGFVFVPLTLEMRTLQQGSASSDVDFEARDQTITLTNGNNVECVTFTTIPDNLFEETEEFFVGLFPPATFIIDIEPPSVAISIIDNDVVTVGLVSTQIQVNEESGAGATSATQIMVCAEVSGDGQLQSDVTFTLSVTPGGAREEFDFEVLDDEIVVAAEEEDNECGLIVTVPDPILETDEQFTISIELQSASIGQITVSPATATVTIIDNDDIQIGIEQDDIEIQISEDDSGASVSTMVCAGIISAPVETIVFNLAVTPMDGTAVEGTDFNGGTQTLTLDEDTDRACATFTTIPNTTPELDREFTVELSLASTTGDSADVLIQPSTSTITIIDNDLVSVGFQMDSYSITEDDTGGQDVTACVVQNSASELPVDVLVEIIGGSATFGTDYTGDTSSTLTIDSGDPVLNQCVTFTTVADTDIEQDEDIILSLSSGDAIVVITVSEATINIIDNDFGLMQTALTVSEVAPSVQVCAIALSDSVRSVISSDGTVTLATDSGTAIAGSDFISNSVILTFPSTTQCLDVTLIDDTDVEGNEAFTVSISNVPASLTASPSSATVDIVDDDSAGVCLFLESGTEDVDVVLEEDSGDFEICALLTGDIARSVTTRLVIRSGTARFGQDFEVQDNRATHDLTFSPGGDTEECVVVTIADDPRTESFTEDFTYSLVQQDSQITVDEPSSGTGTIIDNDRECRFNFCLFGGTCEIDQETNVATCICDSNFTGTFCETML